MATQGEGRGAHDTQGDGDGGDEEDDVEREHLPEVDADVEQVAKHDETDDGTRGDQDDHDLAEHLLKVSELVHALHEVRGLAEEGLGAGGGDGGLDLAAGHRRSHLCLGSGVHRHRERFAASAAWSTWMGFPSRRMQSAGIAPPAPRHTISPGTSSVASML